MVFDKNCEQIRKYDFGDIYGPLAYKPPGQDFFTKNSALSLFKPA